MSTDVVSLLAAVLAAAGVAVASLGLARLVRWRLLDRRIRQHVGTQLAPPGETQPGAKRRPPRTKRGGSRLSPGLQRRLRCTSYGALVQASLTRAGLSLKPSGFILLQAGAGGLLALAGLVLGSSALAGRALAGAALGGAALGGIGAAAPLLVLKVLVARRLAAFESQLPSAIEAMAATLQAGSSLQQALAVLAREMPAPISDEFRRVLREADLGLSFSDSLAGLMDRVPSKDLVIFISAISIQQRVGGDLARILQVIGYTIRERLRIRGETKVLTAQARYSAYVVAGLPILLFVFLWTTNYQYLSGLFLPGTMRYVLVGGVVGIAVGFYSMQKMAAVEL